MHRTRSTRLAIPLVLLLAACDAGAPAGSGDPTGGPSPTPIGALAWTQVDPDPGSDAGPVAVIGWNGGLLGVGYGRTWSSPDGIAWTAGEELATDRWGLMDLVALDGRAIAAGEIGSTATLWTTTDGTTWSVSTDPDLVAVAPYTRTSIDRLVAGAGGMVAVGTEGGNETQRPVAWWSADGVDWVRTTQPLEGSGLRDAATDGTAWVAVGAATVPAEELTKAAFWRSPDGRSWTELADDGARAYKEPQAVAWTGAGYVAVGYEGLILREGPAFRPQAWRSPDGASWSGVPATADTSIWPFPGPTPVSNEAALWGGMMVDLVTLPGGLLAVGTYWGLDPSIANKDGGHTAMAYRGVAWTSTDGAAWTLAAQPLFTAPANPSLESGSTQYALARVADVDGRPVVTGVVPGAGSVVWRGSPAP